MFKGQEQWLPSEERLHNYGKIHHFQWFKSTISMAIFNSYVSLPEGSLKLAYHGLLENPSDLVR